MPFAFLEKYFAQQKCKKGKSPAFVCQYLEQLEQAMYRQSFAESRFVVFDTETTGLNPQQDRILSIGAVALTHEALVIEDSMEIFVRQLSGGTAQSIVIHQITEREREKGLTETEALEQFLAYAKADILVAHHAYFDVNIVSNALKRLFGIKLWNPYIDTMYLFKRLEMNHLQNDELQTTEWNLDALCQRYGIEIDGIRHNAASDAWATALLFQKLLKKADQRGIRAAKELI